MRYLDLDVMNFMSIRKAKAVLSGQGLVLIQGIHRGNDSYDSNGSGKSSFFVEAPTWCLFGVTVRGLKADDIVNKKAKRNCAVSMGIEDDDGSVYRVARYRKHADFQDSVMLFKDGGNITGATNDETNKKIEDLLQMDFLTFTNSVMYGQSMAKVFAVTTDSEKKKIMEQMLQIDVFRLCQEKTKEKLKLVHIDQERVNVELGYAENTYQALYTEIEDLKNHKDTQAAQVQSELTRLQSEKQLIVNQLRLFPSDKSMQDELSKATLQLDAINNKLSLYVKTSIDYTEVLGELKAAQREKDTKAQELTSMYNYIEGLGNGEIPEGSMCPHCGNAVTPESIGHLVDSLNAEYNEEYSKYEEYDVVIQRLTQTSNDMAKQLEGKSVLEGEKYKWVQTISAKKQDIHNSVQLRGNLQRNLDSVNKSIESLTSGAVDTLEKSIVTKQKALEATAKVYNEKLAEIDGFNSTAAVYEFWVEAFSDSGIKSHLLDSVTPFLNERADYYSQILSDGTLNVEFSTVTPLKNKKIVDKFNVAVGNLEGGDDYKANSGGERRRIDLAILFALQDLVASRSQKSMNMIVYDEIFDALDGVGVEKAIQVLQEKQTKCESVFVITHNPLLAGYFENVINVVKEKGETTIE